MIEESNKRSDLYLNEEMLKEVEDALNEKINKAISNI